MEMPFNEMEIKNNNRILIIGGTGFIGSNLVRYLTKANHEVLVYHKKESNLKNLQGLNFKSIVGNLTDNNNLEKDIEYALEGCTAVYNLAVVDSTHRKHYSLMEDININAARVVAQIARKACNIRLIHVSSSAAAGYSENDDVVSEKYNFNSHYDHYALTKYKGEMAVLKEVEKGLDAVIAIPCSTVGAAGIKKAQFNIFRNIAKGEMRFYPPGGICLTNINDLVRGLYKCYENGISGRRYILGGYNITYKQYFDEIASAAKGRAPNIRLPKIVLPLLGYMMETFSYLLNKNTIINANIARMISKNLYYTSGLAQKELGYTITDWKDTIRMTVEQLNITCGEYKYQRNLIS